MTDGAKPVIDAALAARLVAAQFPQWAHLPVRPVAVSGWDNRTFHLGEAMIVRLPSAAPYASQAEKERTWLPRLAGALPVAVPAPLGLGAPGQGYPWPWAVYGWIAGRTAEETPPADEARFARDLGAFLAALHRIDPAGGPAAGPQNFFRGGPLSTYDGQVREALTRLEGRADTGACRAVWEAALAAGWAGPAVWVHGDFAPRNLLVDEGRLCGVIDFGQLGVGDPACDLAIAWSFLGEAGRAALREALPLDEGTWARGRGWALWKALILVSGVARGPARDVAASEATLAAVLADRAAGD